MIRLPPFEVSVPGTIPDLLESLRPNGETPKIIAGGTDLLVNMKQGLHQTRRLVWPGRIEELRRLDALPGGEIGIGAMATLSDVASSDIIRTMYPSLSDAVLSVATPAIRNRATIGGNLCLDTRCFFYNKSEFWRGSLGGCLKLEFSGNGNGGICHAAPGSEMCAAVSSSDSAPILLALNASVEIRSVFARRVIPLSSFYMNDGMKFLGLAPGECLTRIFLPEPRPGLVAAHDKVRLRQSIDFPIVNVGIAGILEGGKVFTSLRIYVGALQSAPVRITGAEALLEGKAVTSALIEQAAEQAASTVKPIPNTGGTIGYRKRMVAVLVKRVLARLLESA